MDLEVNDIYKNICIEDLVQRLKDSEANLEENKLKTEYFANLSHELKTPLTSIKGFTELLRSGTVNDDETRNKYLDLVLLEAERLIYLINDILKLSELESIRIEGKTMTDISKLAEDTVSLLMPVARVHKVKLDLETAKCDIEANPSRLKELFINLVENGIKYNKENGSVKITVSCSSEYALIRISDTGIGIPEEDKDRVFERFYRVDKSRSKATGGTGLGLSIVKHIVLLYKGTINLESTVGKGTTIEIRLPRSSNN
jgi:two-component system phosphate regulon sensor histidine kinase PhoR